jgi:hypothetical protein
MQRDLKFIFPHLTADEISKKLLIVATFQPSCVDLVGVGSNVEEEKDRLLENVSQFLLLCVCCWSI